MCGAGRDGEGHGRRDGPGVERHARGGAHGAHEQRQAQDPREVHAAAHRPALRRPHHHRARTSTLPRPCPCLRSSQSEAPTRATRLFGRQRSYLYLVDSHLHK